MSLTLAAWIVVFSGLFVLAFYRPAFAVALYMFTYFLCPPFWWWGDPIQSYRWSLISGVVLLVSVLCSRVKAAVPLTPLARRCCTLLVCFLINATFVQLALAKDSSIGADSYFLMSKLVLLVFMIVLAVQSSQDLRIVMLSIVLGAGYVGYEVTINERGTIERGRLEGIGAPGAKSANQFASMMITVLPITGAFFLGGNKWERIAMFFVAPMILNVILLCNSRGAFLGALASAVVFLFAAPAVVRKQAILIIALGSVATYMLLGDQQIIDRFMSIFVEGEERDNSSQSRIFNWKAGLRCVKDYPLGTGGHGFKRVHAVKYLGRDDQARSVHNGFINDAIEWGVQGLSLHLFIIGGAGVLMWRSARWMNTTATVLDRLNSCAFLAGITAFLISSVFGDFMDAEWGYWIVAISIAQSRTIRLPARRDAPVAESPLEEAAGVPEFQLAAGP